MKVDETRHGAVVILRPSGRLDSAAAPAFEERLLGHAAGERPAVLIDMSELEYLSSTGLRILLVAAKRINQAAGRLSLCAAQEQVLDVLEISGVARAFRMHAAPGDALAELKGDA